MSANAMTGDNARCLEVGMNGYLSKPTRLDDLRAALHRAVPPLAPKPIWSAGGRSWRPLHGDPPRRSGRSPAAV